jgi:hypothetical protein
MNCIYVGILAAVLICLYIQPVSATQNDYDFQNPGDFISYVICNVTGYSMGSCTYDQNLNGGNSGVRTTVVAEEYVPFFSTFAGFENLYPNPYMTYYAVSYKTDSECSDLRIAQNYIRLRDASGYYFPGNILYTFFIPCSSDPVAGRYELFVYGSKAYLYNNGTQIMVSDDINQPPTYIEAGIFTQSGGSLGSGTSGTTFWDDVVYGDNDEFSAGVVLGSPQLEAYQLKKDSVNPAASGFYSVNGTIISNFNMTTTYSFRSPNTPKTVYLKNYAGSIVGSYTTPEGSMFGEIHWPIQSDIFNNTNAIFGYYVTTIPGTVYNNYSETIPYVGSGATIAWGSDTYTDTNTGTISWNVSESYWYPSTYSYKVCVVNGASGVFIQNTTVTSQTGSISIPFSSSAYPQGTYYAELFFTTISDSSEIFAAQDSTAISNYVGLNGYVLNAENITGISGATVNITQGTGASVYKTTDSTGYWSSTDPWITGEIMYVTATKSGYDTSYTNLTPETAKIIPYNITMIPSDSVCLGICLNGIVYNKLYTTPLGDATVTIVNTSTNYTASKTTNIAGYYRFDYLTNNMWYNITGTSTGFQPDMVQARMSGT